MIEGSARARANNFLRWEGVKKGASASHHPTNSRGRQAAFLGERESSAAITCLRRARLDYRV